MTQSGLDAVAFWPGLNTEISKLESSIELVSDSGMLLKEIVKVTVVYNDLFDHFRTKPAKAAELNDSYSAVASAVQVRHCNRFPSG